MVISETSTSPMLVIDQNTTKWSGMDTCLIMDNINDRRIHTIIEDHVLLLASDTVSISYKFIK